VTTAPPLPSPREGRGDNGQIGGCRYWHPANARFVMCEANVPLGTAGPALSVDGTQSGVPALPLTKALPSTM